MDGKQFDRLTKGLSSSASRRRMLGGLGAVAAGLLTRQSAAAKPKPINPGCEQAGRTCTPGTCCGNLECAGLSGLSRECQERLGTSFTGTKCCRPRGQGCSGHCQCCSDSVGCFDGQCGG